MSPTGLEPLDLLKLLEADLTPFVADRKGLLSIAAEPWDFLELLAERPNGWRAVLLWEGDDNTQDNALAGRFLKNTFSIGITCQKGLAVKAGEYLLKTRADGGLALLALVAEIRARVGSYIFPDNVSDRYPLYLGTAPLTLPDATPLAGYRLRFALVTTPEPIAYRE
jgi:hypothetical protein